MTGRKESNGPKNHANRLETDALPLIGWVLITLILALICSCQKVIDLDLNSASPQLVVEGIITDNPGPYFVRLTKSVSFNSIEQIPVVTGATVEISDSSTGVREVLQEMPGGIYRTSILSGTPGHRYRLLVKTGSQDYEADSDMPFPVSFSKVTISRGGGDSPFDNGNNTSYTANYEINDPADHRNYYRIIVTHNNRMISWRRVFDDQFHNGKIISDDLDLHDSTGFYPGDTIRLDLLNIDKDTYNFFRTLRNASGGAGFLSASPANPISNISDNGLGYFSACSVRSIRAVIP